MKKNQGFTLIELMIVIAIIAIIAAIAIPNLMQSRVRANEATAISAIKQIATGQVTFQVGKQGRGRAGWPGGANGYCDNYRNLAFAQPVGSTTATDKLALVSDVVGNAFIEATGGGTAAIGTGSGVSATSAPYQGYVFSSDPDVTWTVDYACYAWPQQAGTTGSNAYWVGQQGAVYIQGLAPVAAGTTVTALASGATPQTTPIPAAWSAM